MRGRGVCVSLGAGFSEQFVERRRVPRYASLGERSCSRYRGLRSNLSAIANSDAKFFRCAGRLPFERRFALLKKTKPVAKVVRLSSSSASTKSSRYRNPGNRKSSRASHLMTSDSLRGWLVRICPGCDFEHGPRKMFAVAAGMWYDVDRSAGRRSSSVELVADGPNPRTKGWTEVAVSPFQVVDRSGAARSSRAFGPINLRRRGVATRDSRRKLPW